MQRCPLQQVPYSTPTNHLTPTFQQEFSLEIIKKWLLTHKNCWFCLVCQEVGPLHSHSSLYLCFFVLDNSLPSEILCVWKFLSYPRLDCLNIGDMVSKSGLVRFPGGGNGSQFQCSYLEKLMDRGPWQTSIHGNHKELDTTELLSTHT